MIVAGRTSAVLLATRSFRWPARGSIYQDGVTDSNGEADTVLAPPVLQAGGWVTEQIWRPSEAVRSLGRIGT